MGSNDGEHGPLVAQLQARAAQLRVELGRKLESASLDVSEEGRADDSGDRSFAVGESEIEQGEAARDRAELAAIERTLARIRDGSYGVCGECGVVIPVERLRAQPLASRCTGCQSQREERSTRR